MLLSALVQAAINFSDPIIGLDRVSNRWILYNHVLPVWKITTGQVVFQFHPARAYAMEQINHIWLQGIE